MYNTGYSIIVENIATHVILFSCLYSRGIPEDTKTVSLEKAIEMAGEVLKKATKT